MIRRALRVATTPRYAVYRDQFGWYEIVRLSDSASVYLQGDDALLFEQHCGVERLTPTPCR